MNPELISMLNISSSFADYFFGEHPLSDYTKIYLQGGGDITEHSSDKNMPLSLLFLQLFTHGLIRVAMLPFGIGQCFSVTYCKPQPE